MNRVSYKVSLGGIISAISLFFLFCTGFLPLFVYIIPAFCGAMLVIIYVEINTKWAVVSYVAVSVLSLFITPDKEACFLYIMLMGYYPIILQYLEKIKPFILKIIVKLAIYNITIIAYYQLVIHIVSSTDLTDDIGDFGKYGALIFLGLTNIAFIIYDLAINRLKYIYTDWFRKKIIRKI